MSSVQTPQKPSSSSESSGNALLDQTARAVFYFQENKSTVYGALAVVVLLAFGVAGYFVYMQQQAGVAAEHLGRILPVYEQGEYQKALDGVEALDPTNPRSTQPGQAEARLGLIEIADQYSGTSAGNLAAFYAGNAYFNMGDYDNALAMYQSFDKESNFIGASTYAAEATIYESRGDLERAAEYYLEAAEAYESETRTPEYLLDAARAFESAGNLSRAEELYTQIQDEYSDSAAASDADVFLARLKARQASTS